MASVNSSELAIDTAERGAAQRTPVETGANDGTSDDSESIAGLEKALVEVGLERRDSPLLGGGQRARISPTAVFGF